MEFSYFEPAPSLCQFVSSYYFVSLPVEVTDVMRAEIANVRFVLQGKINTGISGEDVLLSEGDSVLCGPTFRWSHIKFSPNTRVFGAAITPLGWRRLIGFNAEDAADSLIPLHDVVPVASKGFIDEIYSAADNQQIVNAADLMFMSMISNTQRIHDNFIKQATDWIVDPEPNEIEHLLDHVDISHRQVERLCKTYFGSGPKKLHRKFRALHAANRLTWGNMSDWRDVARTAYYDQAHFIREFKQFNGRTPQEFMDGPHILVRMTLQERLKINHASPFSLVG